VLQIAGPGGVLDGALEQGRGRERFEELEVAGAWLV
jgi:hypothetical protein